MLKEAMIKHELGSTIPSDTLKTLLSTPLENLPNQISLHTKSIPPKPLSIPIDQWASLSDADKLTLNTLCNGDPHKMHSLLSSGNAEQQIKTH